MTYRCYNKSVVGSSAVLNLIPGSGGGFDMVDIRAHLTGIGIANAILTFELIAPGPVTREALPSQAVVVEDTLILSIPIAFASPRGEVVRVTASGDNVTQVDIFVCARRYPNGS